MLDYNNKIIRQSNNPVRKAFLITVFLYQIDLFIDFNTLLAKSDSQPE